MVRLACAPFPLSRNMNAPLPAVGFDTAPLMVSDDAPVDRLVMATPVPLAETLPAKTLVAPLALVFAA